MFNDKKRNTGYDDDLNPYKKRRLNDNNTHSSNRFGNESISSEPNQFNNFNAPRYHHPNNEYENIGRERGRGRGNGYHHHHHHQNRNYNNYHHQYQNGGNGGKWNRNKPRTKTIEEPKPRYRDSINPELIEKIKGLHLDKRGVQTLHVWNDPKNKTIYEESRYRENKVTKKTKDEKAKLMSLNKVPSNIEKTTDPLSIDRWISDIPRPNKQYMTLTFIQKKCNIITNALKVDDKSVYGSQHVFNVIHTETKENVDDNDTIKQQIYKRSARKLRSLHPHYFDKKHILSCNPSPIHKIEAFPINTFGDKYTVSTELTSICDPLSNKISFHKYCEQINPHHRELFLAVPNRERFFNAGYNKLWYDDDIFYNLRDPMDDIKQETNLIYPDASLMMGYHCTIHYAQNENILIKTNQRCKLIMKDSVYDIIKKYGMKEAKSFCMKKNGITNYSNSKKQLREQKIWIDDIKETMGLNDTFDRRYGGSISFGEYYSKEKGIKLMHGDQVLIESNQRGQKNYFPSELIYILLRNDNISSNTKGIMRRKRHGSIEDIIKAGIAINDRLNKSSPNIPFKTLLNPVTVTGYILNDPLIIYKGKNNNIIKVNTKAFNGKQWSQVGDLWYNGNDKGNRKWIIYYDKNIKTDKLAAENVLNHFERFCRSRKFKQAPLCKISKYDIVALDYNDLSGIRDTVRNNKCSISLFIISNDVIGSKSKIDITRHVFFAKEPNDAISNNFNNHQQQQQQRRNMMQQYKRYRMKIELSFVTEQKTNDRDPIYSVFENMILKCGIGLYRVDPMLPSKRFNSNIWVIGIHVLRKNGINLAVLSCITKPFEGSLASITNHWCLLNKKTDVIPQNVMKQFIDDILTENVEKALKNNNKLPNNIIFIRCGGGDSLFPMIISKELSGIKQRISSFTKQNGTKIKRLTDGINNKWHPGIIYSVMQEHCIDVFGQVINNKINMISDTIIINGGITSCQYLDFYLSYECKQEYIYQRVLRFITLCDEYNDDDITKRASLYLRNEKELISDYYQIIYSLFWLYPSAIPFSMTPKVPSVIAAAKHFAEWRFQLITKKDTDIKQLTIDIDNTKPKLVAIRKKN